jgi:iron complex transport system ATP-binding protein
MSVKDYVLLGRTPYIPYLGTEDHLDVAVVDRVLEDLSLEPFARRRLGSLSGGELQRAILARALAQEPQILLLDEPTSGMDIGHQQVILELIDSLRAERGLTVLSAIHDLTLAGQFPDRLLLLNEGRAWASGTPRSVLTEELIGAHYGAAVRILNDSPKAIAVVPLRATGQRQDPWRSRRT